MFFRPIGWFRKQKASPKVTLVYSMDLDMHNVPGYVITDSSDAHYVRQILEGTLLPLLPHAIVPLRRDVIELDGLVYVSSLQDALLTHHPWERAYGPPKQMTLKQFEQMLKLHQTKE